MSTSKYQPITLIIPSTPAKSKRCLDCCVDEAHSFFASRQAGPHDRCFNQTVSPLNEMASPVLSLPRHYRLRRIHIVIAVVGSDYNHVLLTGAVARQRKSEVIVLSFRIRELAGRLDEVPIASVQRIFR